MSVPPQATEQPALPSRIAMSVTVHRDDHLVDRLAPPVLEKPVYDGGAFRFQQGFRSGKRTGKQGDATISADADDGQGASDPPGGKGENCVVRLILLHTGLVYRPEQSLAMNAGPIYNALPYAERHYCETKRIASCHAFKGSKSGQTSPRSRT